MEIKDFINMVKEVKQEFPDLELDTIINALGVKALLELKVALRRE